MKDVDLQVILVGFITAANKGKRNTRKMSMKKGLETKQETKEKLKSSRVFGKLFKEEEVYEIKPEKKYKNKCEKTQKGEKK